MSAKHWCFTLNNYTEEERAELFACERVVYIIIGREVGEEGTSHLQGYISFDCRKKLSALKRIQPRAHWEVAKGTPEQNRTYCSKEGDFEEQGTIPLSGPQANKQKWDNIKALAKARDWDAIDSDVLIRHVRNLERIADLLVPPVSDLDDVCGVWIWGPSGVGKSTYARKTYPGLYDKPLSKWWCRYDFQDHVLLDDISPNHEYLGDYLKRWADKYTFIAEKKGSHVQIRPKTIIVTSQYSIESIFTDAQCCMALLRRFRVIHMTSSLSPAC